MLSRRSWYVLTIKNSKLQETLGVNLIFNVFGMHVTMILLLR